MMTFFKRKRVANSEANKYAVQKIFARYFPMTGICSIGFRFC